jgi:aminopeptidase YwaD
MIHNGKMILVFVLLINTVLLSHATGGVPAPADTVSVSEISRHVYFLASEALEGRRAGTPEARKAAEYIANRFSEYGLLPSPDAVSPSPDPNAYFQPFEFVSGIERGKNNHLTVTRDDGTVDLELEKDFQPLPFSATGSITGSVVFGGFGISAPGEGYDDYADIDLSGKIVLVFQGSPDENDPHGTLSQFATPRNKTIAAREAGAAGLLLITRPDEGDTTLMRLRVDRSPATSGLPAINIIPHTADLLLEGTGKTSEILYANLVETKKGNSFDINGITLSIQTDLLPVISECNNVIGFLPGSDPDLAGEVVIIGAHYDHLGWGGDGSLVPDEQAIHHGADDNASGTAGILELARIYSAKGTPPKRSLLFIAFSAEEIGLIGSQHYVQNPYLPKDSTIAMINLDMIGRLTNNELTIFGVGTSPIWEEIIPEPEEYNLLEVRTNPDGFGPSDHASFYAQNIPVLFFHTGLHGDYHRPSDTAEKINYDGMATIVSYVYDIVRRVDRFDERPAFVRAESPRPRGAMRGIRVYVGTMPDYVGESGGMRVTGVRSESPAEKAGILTGDVIIKFGGKTIENIYDYTYALGEFNPGDIVEVIVKRDGEEMIVELELGTRN